MRLSAEWMTGADDRILEFLAEEGPKSPKKMHEDGRVRYSRTYINTRCKKLEKNKLLVHYGNGVYDITDLGRQYLAGELDVLDLDEDGSENEHAASA